VVRARSTRTAPVRALTGLSIWMFSLQSAMNIVPVFAPAQLRASCVPKLPAHEARPQATTSAAGRLHGIALSQEGFVPENREKVPRTPGFPCNHARCVAPGATCSTETNDSKS
jgi:hypothetical protein